jgi:hypothetical protein
MRAGTAHVVLSRKYENIGKLQKEIEHFQTYKSEHKIGG